MIFVMAVGIFAARPSFNEVDDRVRAVLLEINEESRGPQLVLSRACKEMLIELFKIFPEKIKLFSSFYKGEMVAGVVNFVVNEHVVLAFYISHNQEYNDLSPLNLLFFSMFEWAIKSNYKIYDFGIFTVDGVPNMGLGRFKENFGASGIFRDTFEIAL